MCLITLAWQRSSRYPLILAANRDEAHARPTASAAWWDELPEVFGGRDLVAGGSWLAVNAAGRLAAVTNVYEPPRRDFPLSRGALVREFLAGTERAPDFLARIAPDRLRYGPFHLLLYDGAVHYGSNRDRASALAPGIHVLSNALNGTAWPKVARAEAGMAAAIREPDPVPALFSLLAERAEPGSDHASSREHLEATLFVANSHYGTRCTTIVLLDAAGELTFIERRFGPRGKLLGDTSQHFRALTGRQRA